MCEMRGVLNNHSDVLNMPTPNASTMNLTKDELPTCFYMWSWGLESIAMSFIVSHGKNDGLNNLCTKLRISKTEARGFQGKLLRTEGPFI